MARRIILVLLVALFLLGGPFIAQTAPAIAASTASAMHQPASPRIGGPTGDQPVSRSGSTDDTPPSAAAAPASFSQGFDDVTLLTGQGWFMQNNSSPLGATSWFQGSTAAFSAQAGATNSYIAVNYNSTTGSTGTISNWLLTPHLALANGDILTFWTRTVSSPAFPDRLQVRLSTAGASTNVGTLATDVGDFTTLLLDINPTLTIAGYPNTWTQYTITLSGLSGGATGRFAFRYFVTNGGPSGINSDYIGIDTADFSGTPLAVTLASFQAEPQVGQVLVTWETASELGNAGFNLYRGDSAAGPQTLLAYVPSQAPGSAQGFAYSYEDADVQSGQTYWYWLEDLDVYGATTLHGPVSATVQAPTAVTLSSVSASPTAPPIGAALPWLLAAAGAGAALALGRRRR